MNRNFLTGLLLSLALSFMAQQLYACTTAPTAKIVSPDAQYVCVGGSASFDGEGSGTAVPPTGSYDGDNGDPHGGGNGIDIYYWNYSDDSDWHEDGGTPSHTFNGPAGYYYVYLYVRDDEGVLSAYDTCYVCVIRVESVEEDKTSACINETVTFTAISYPSYKTLSCVEWQKSYRANSTDPWGDWTAAGSGSTAILNTDTPGYYKYQARNGSDDSWKPSSVITVVRAKIVEAPEHVLVYTGSHSGEQPTRNAIARGDPKGGTFSWSYEKSGDGEIEFVGFTDGPPGAPMSSQIAEIRGTTQSSDYWDVKLKVTYTLSGKECEATCTYTTVRKPKTTSSHAGECTEGDPKHHRKYYHVVYCQLGYFLDDLGIPFDEVVTPEGSDTSAGSTQYCDPDGAWLGGIAVPDTLACPADSDDATFHQKLYGGGWLTTPEFNLYFQPMEEWPSIWKTIAP